MVLLPAIEGKAEMLGETTQTTSSGFFFAKVTGYCASQIYKR